MSVYVTYSQWKYHGYQVFIQGVPGEGINHILIWAADNVIKHKNYTMVISGCGTAVINESNIDHLLFLIEMSKYAVAPIQDNFVSHDYYGEYHNVVLATKEKIAICNINQSLHIGKNDLTVILKRIKREIKLINDEMMQNVAKDLEKALNNVDKNKLYKLINDRYNEKIKSIKKSGDEE